MNKLAARLCVGLCAIIFSLPSSAQEVLFFTQPGCAPCEKMYPELDVLRQQGVTVRVFDWTRTTDASVFQQFGIRSTPTTFVTDSQGRVVKSFSGYIPANAVLSAMPTRAGPSVGRTKNFNIRSNRPDLAQKFAEVAESYRCLLNDQWFPGKKLPDWDKPAEVVITVDNTNGGGVTTFVHTGETAVDFNGKWQGQEKKLLADVIPHEVMHMVLATHVGEPLPRWLDEGIAVTVESPESRDSSRDMAMRSLQSQELPSVSAVFRYGEQYPPNVMGVYWSGQLMVEYLLSLPDGRERIIQYINEGTDKGFEPALHTVYRMGDCKVFEGRVRGWLSGLRQRLPRFGNRIPGNTSYLYVVPAEVCPKCGKIHPVPGVWQPQQEPVQQGLGWTGETRPSTFPTQPEPNTEPSGDDLLVVDDFETDEQKVPVPPRPAPWDQDIIFGSPEWRELQEKISQQEAFQRQYQIDLEAKIAQAQQTSAQAAESVNQQLKKTEESLIGRIRELAKDRAVAVAKDKMPSSVGSAMAVASKLAPYLGIAGAAGTAGLGVALFVVSRRLKKRISERENTKYVVPPPVQPQNSSRDEDFPSAIAVADHPSRKPVVFATENPPPKQIKVPTQHYVTVESDDTLEALDWAKEQIAKKYGTNAKFYMETLQGMMTQYRNAREST